MSIEAMQDYKKYVKQYIKNGKTPRIPEVIYIAEVYGIDSVGVMDSTIVEKVRIWRQTKPRDRTMAWEWLQYHWLFVRRTPMEFPYKRPVMWTFDISIAIIPNKLLNIQSNITQKNSKLHIELRNANQFKYPTEVSNWQ